MMAMSLIKLSLVLLLIMTAYDLVTKEIPSRLRSEQAPKSGFGIIPVNEFGSHADSDEMEYVPNSPFNQGFANALK